MKTTKLAIGIGGAVMAMVAFAAPAPAQAGAGGSTGTVGGGGGGVFTRLTRPIIYDYEKLTPNPVRRVHLMIAADGSATLVDEVGARRRVLMGHLTPADRVAIRSLAAKLLVPIQPGDDVSTGAAAGDLASRRVLTMRIGPLAIRHDAAMALPAGRMVSQRLDQIVAWLAAN
jgi:hypothetical protein